MSERRDSSPEALLAYLDGDLPAGRRGAVEGALAASPACRRRLRRLDETGLLLRAGTPLVDDAPARTRLRVRLGAERAALGRRGASRRIVAGWRRPGLTVALTAAALPLVLLLSTVATRPFADAGGGGGIGRPASLARHAGEPTAHPTVERAALAAAPRWPATGRQRFPARPRLAFACETPRRVAAAPIARPDATARRRGAAPPCFPVAAMARPPAWPHTAPPPKPGGLPAAPRHTVVRRR